MKLLKKKSEVLSKTTTASGKGDRAPMKTVTSSGKSDRYGTVEPARVSAAEPGRKQKAAPVPNKVNRKVAPEKAVATQTGKKELTFQQSYREGTADRYDRKAKRVRDSK